jgi:ligand-binding SRPBCC domain-containing protein
MQFPIFVHRSVIEAPAREVFEWHEQPEALLELLPSTRFIRILRRSGGLRDGGRILLAMGIGPLRLMWEAVHFGYVKGEQFSDELIRGPFRVWRHTHRVAPLTESSSVLEDRVEYALPGGWIMHAIAGGVVHRFLVAMFERRHAITRAHVEKRTCRVACR